MAVMLKSSGGPLAPHAEDFREEARLTSGLYA